MLSVFYDSRVLILFRLRAQVEYRADKSGQVSVPVGKLSFSNRALDENITSFISQLIAARPAAARGEFILSATLTSTQCTIGVPLNIQIAPFRMQRHAASESLFGRQSVYQAQLDELREKFRSERLSASA